MVMAVATQRHQLSDRHRRLLLLRQINLGDSSFCWLKESSFCARSVVVSDTEGFVVFIREVGITQIAAGSKDDFVSTFTTQAVVSSQSINCGVEGVIAALINYIRPRKGDGVLPECR